MQTSWAQLKVCTHRPYVHIHTHILFNPVCICLLIGWAATVTYNPRARAEFEQFRRRDDTLSLGVCNGCQLLALLGWVGEREEGGGGRQTVWLWCLLITVSSQREIYQDNDSFEDCLLSTVHSDSPTHPLAVCLSLQSLMWS